MSVHPPPAPVRVRPRTASAAATLDHAAEFSAFPGQDRVFIVAAGTLELTIDGITRFLSLGDEQRFPGEAGAHADPGAEPAFALNVMSARVSHVAEVAVIRIDGPVPQADALVVLQGRVEAEGTALAPFDAVVPANPAHGADALVVLITVRSAAW